MASVHQLFRDYESYHTTAGNKITHPIGIPTIALALFGLASKIGPPGAPFSIDLVYEKNRPAFHRNAIHMMVGPLWVASLLLRRVGLYRPA